jgi:hypothetical protein
MTGAHVGRVPVVRSQIRDGVIAPVIGQAAIDEERIGHILVHRQQFHRRHAEVDQVLDGGRMTQARVRTPYLGRNIRMGHRKTFDVDLVDDRVWVGIAWTRTISPGEGRVHHETSRDACGRVEAAGAVGVVNRIAQHLRASAHAAGGGLRVRIQQQLVGIAAISLARVAKPCQMLASCSWRDSRVSRPSASNRHRSVPSAMSDASAKLVPPMPGVAPSGNGLPGNTVEEGFMANRSPCVLLPQRRSRRSLRRGTPGHDHK